MAAAEKYCESRKCCEKWVGGERGGARMVKEAGGGNNVGAVIEGRGERERNKRGGRTNKVGRKERERERERGREGRRGGGDRECECE